MEKLIFIAIASVMLILPGCSGNRRVEHQAAGPPYQPMSQSAVEPLTTITYAKRFSISYYPGYKKILLNEAWPGSHDTLTYIVTGDLKTAEQFKKDEEVTLILQPNENVVCFSTTHLPFLEMIRMEDRIGGFPTTDYIYSEKIRQRVESGHIRDLGPSNEINFEALLSLDPDLVFAFSMGNDLSMIHKMELSGIQVVLNADYMEDHPLGRAEWIKFVAAFFDRDREADSVFSHIERSYLTTKARMDGLDARPTVFTGVVYGDTWFMPGGRNYGSIFFGDAGGKYIWSDNEDSQILQLSFESVYEKAGSADFWIGTATYNSLKEIELADVRYTDFKAFNTGQVYNYSARTRPEGGIDYFEMGYARPDLILKDLAKILHPAEMEGHPFYFYKKLY